MTVSTGKRSTAARRRGLSRLAKRRLGTTVLYVLLIAGSLAMAFPLLWMLSTSFKTLEEANGAQLVLLPSRPQLDGYVQVLQNFKFARSYANSVFVALLAVGGTVASIAAVGYAFSRVEWPGRGLVFGLMLSTMMIPMQTTLVPQYVIFSKLKWIGTFNPITIPGFFAGGAYMVFLLRQFMSQIPRELDEAARIDGAGHIRIWWHVILPLSKPALATIATMLFIGNWNSLQMPVIYLQNSSLYTLPLFVFSLINPMANTQPWPSIMAASVLTTLPVVIIFMLAQGYFLESIMISGSKG